MVKPGGRLAYVTCSVLPEENADQVRAFLGRTSGFAAVPPREAMAPLGERAEAFAGVVRASDEGLLMTPRRTGTDGFFVCLLRRSG